MPHDLPSIGLRLHSGMDPQPCIELAKAAEANGLEWFLPKLAVTFANDGRPPVPGEAIREELENLHGRTRTTCQNSCAKKE